MFDAELANVTGNPAMSIPFGLDPAGLPVGIHVLGRFGDEASLFRLAAQLERANALGLPYPSAPTEGSMMVPNGVHRRDAAP